MLIKLGLSETKRLRKIGDKYGFSIDDVIWNS